MSDVYIGLDIGASNIRVAIYNSENMEIQITRKFQFTKCETVQEEVDINICNIIDESIKKIQEDLMIVKGIGISLAANFDRDTGHIIKWPNNIMWNNFEFKRYLEKKYKVTIILEDDANSASVGEYVYGTAKGNKNFIYLTVSTGIGCGMILNGELYKGENGFAGEIGHTKVWGNKKKCVCGESGCLQAIASGRVLEKKLKEEIIKKNIYFLENITVEEIIKNNLLSKETIKKAFEECTGYIGDTILMLSTLFDISTFVIGGGLGTNSEYFFKPLIEEIEKSSTKKLKIKKTILQDFNGVIGAINIIYKHLNSCDIKIDNLYKVFKF